jgi:hypothetical protein
VSLDGALKVVEWIRQGAPADLSDTAHVVGVRLVPDKLVLKPGQPHRVQLIAEYTTRIAAAGFDRTEALGRRASVYRDADL